MKREDHSENITDQFQVQEKSSLQRFLFEMYPKKSHHWVKSLLKFKQVLVDDQIKTQFNYELSPGQTVKISATNKTQIENLEGIKIVYEDDSILAIEKPAGLLSVATDKEKKRNAHWILMTQRIPAKKIFVLHRLDRDASGLMLFAKSEMVKENLQKAWDKTVIERKYFVVIEGCPEKKEGEITSWLSENKFLKMVSSPTPNNGKKAVTQYKVLQSNAVCSLLDVSLVTGRKNQVRVHMQDMQHPVIGDKKYGAKTNPLKRLGLHAYRIAFIHPVTGRTIYLKTPIPKVFSKLFGKKGKTLV